MSFTVNEVEHCWIPISDGIRLSARLWLPETNEARPTPAVLEYIPYRKRDMVRLRDERNHPFFARHGYACIRVDMRGSGDSEGLMEDMYSPQEINDGLEVIQWIASQPWCNGNVGMMGTSWGGTSSLQIASLQPVPLKAIIAVCATDNRYDDDIHHMGGCLLTDTLEWGATLPVILASPPDPNTVGPQWRRIWQQRLDHCAFPLENWIRHETHDDYWRRGSVSTAPESISCPMLLVGGWVDRYSNTVMNLLARSTNPCWGIVGPWGHHYPDVGSPGPGIDFQQEALRWWDRWLMGQANGIDDEPQLRIWRQEYLSPRNKILRQPGQWISESKWPSPNITSEFYRLGSGMLDNTGSIDSAEKDIVPNSLQIGLASGDTGYFGREGGLPLDQQEDDALSLVFDTVPLKKSLDILGKPILDVTLEVDRPISTLVVRLNDVSPSGETHRVSYGVRNLALDTHGVRDPDLEPGKPCSIRITLPNTAYRFSEGHRIRLAFSSSYWPMIWPAPELSRITLSPAKTQLVLPVRNKPPDEPSVIFLQTMDSEKVAPRAQIDTEPLNRWSQRDVMTDFVSTGWHQPLTRITFHDIAVEYGFETRAEHTIAIDDPHSTCSQLQHRMQFDRMGSVIEVRGTARLQSNTTHYLVSGALQVLEDERLICEHQWNPLIPRRNA